MRFFLDANLNVSLKSPLTTLFFEHEFMTARDLGLQSEDDIPLFGAVAEHGFDYLMTHDRNQLHNPEERRALWKSQLHWIGWASPKLPGIAGLSLEMATVSAALPHILAEAPREPMVYRVRGVPSERGQRLRSYPSVRPEWE